MLLAPFERSRTRRGALAQALLDAARHGPGTVRELAARSQVAFEAARYTASRLVARGELVEVTQGKPVILAAPQAAANASGPDMPQAAEAAPGPDPLQAVLAGWVRAT